MTLSEPTSAPGAGVARPTWGRHPVAHPTWGRHPCLPRRRRAGAAIAWLAVVALLLPLAAFALDPPPGRVVAENAVFRVEVPEGREGLAAALLDQCVAAWGIVKGHTEVGFPVQTTVRWCETEDEFRRATGFRTESVVAAASARRATIWINGSAWRRTPAPQAVQVLVHEYAHVVVGGLAQAPLPRWADEGLAMHLAGQWTLADGLAATRAQLFGGLPGLASIESEFPSDTESMRRAYLMSYLAIANLARRMGATPGNVDPVLHSLESPRDGREFALSLRDPMVRAGIEADARAALGNTTKKWIVYLSSGTTLWLFIVALFLIAYWRKKQRVAEVEARQAEEEEPWARSLTQADIVEIYGEPQDTLPETEEACPESDEEDEERPWE